MHGILGVQTWRDDQGIILVTGEEGPDERGEVIAGVALGGSELGQLRNEGGVSLFREFPDVACLQVVEGAGGLETCNNIHVLLIATINGGKRLFGASDHVSAQRGQVHLGDTCEDCREGEGEVDKGLSVDVEWVFVGHIVFWRGGRKLVRVCFNNYNF